MNRIDVHSPDKPPLAVWVDGDGPPIVLVHGSIADHATPAPLRDELSTDMTTFSMERRGFGLSSDTLPHAIERDFEDAAAAVVDVVAARTGRSVGVVGHSDGAACAIGGVALSPNVAHLVLYEPSLGTTYPPGHGHMAHKTEPVMVADIIRTFASTGVPA